MEQETWAWKTTAYGQLPVFVNKVLLDPSHAHLLTSIAHGCFPATKAELSSRGRDSMAHKPKIFTTWSSQKNGADFWFRRSSTRWRNDEFCFFGLNPGHLLG